MSSLIPDGQSYKQINISVGAQLTQDSKTSLTIDPGEDSKVVSKVVSESGDDQIKVSAFSRYTRIVLTPISGTFGSLYQGSSLPTGMLCQPVTQGSSNITLDVCNTNHSTDAVPASFLDNTSLNGCTVGILIETPAYQQVDVTYNGSFSYAGDITFPAGQPPAITFKRPGAAYFTLTGATFASKPFYWDDGEDNCIIDEGEDGSHAILTNLHEDTNSHSFYLQVVDSQGKTVKSPDPTVVNVQPPPD